MSIADQFSQALCVTDCPLANRMADCAHDNTITCPTRPWSTSQVIFHCLPENPTSDTEKEIHEWVKFPVYSGQWFENVRALSVHTSICGLICIFLNLIWLYALSSNTENMLRFQSILTHGVFAASFAMALVGLFTAQEKDERIWAGVIAAGTAVASIIYNYMLYSHRS